VPTGVDLEAGALNNPVVHAEATLTLALPKQGLRAGGAVAARGALYLADISIPDTVYQRLGIDYRTPFGGGPVVRIATPGPR